jgi:hypothetical protein
MNERYRHRLALCGLTILLVVEPLAAIDPLPPHIEAASEEVRNAYIERLAQESLKEKLEVGKERYDSRMQFKSETVEHMRAEAQERIKVIRAERENLENAESQKPGIGGNKFVYFVCAILLAGMLYFRNRANK